VLTGSARGGRGAAFGGPAAHVALFQKDIVEKERWMTPEMFTELLALGQCLPGPTSTQVSFAIGVVQKGVPGGLLSGALFQYPGFLIMALAGMGAAEVLKNPADWLSAVSAGLSAAGVALVVDACYGLATKLAADRDTQVGGCACG
jgi:chromate transporter